MSRWLAGLAVAALVGSLWAESPEITFSGQAQYRLRGRIFVEMPDTGQSRHYADYYNQIAYYAGMKADFGTALQLRFQLGNDWVLTEAIDYDLNNPWQYSRTANAMLYPFFHLAMAKWNPGPFALTIGMQPVESYGALDLIERSLAKDSYADASSLGWAIGTNGTLLGLRVDIPIVKGDVGLKVSAFSSIIQNRAQVSASEPEKNQAAVLEVLEVPLTAGKLSVTPQVAVIFNRDYSSAEESGDHEVSLGAKATLKATAALSFRAMGAFARRSNENSRLPDDPEVALQGLLAGLGTTASIGPGDLMVDLAISTNENRESENSRDTYPFVDLRYAYKAHSQFKIMPRVRIIPTVYGTSNMALDSKTELRPELIFIGSF